MPRREERQQRLEREARQYREQAERQVTASVWDRDPIKQYIRRFGWLQIIQDYVGRRRNDGVDRPLRYLTIPGSNASDIGLLYKAGLLHRNTGGFPHVAICDMDCADIVSKNLGLMLGVSRRDFYQAVGAELTSYFPFDVINLDICGAIITSSSKRHRALRRLVGIRRIFQLQRGQAFLLLLTTSTDDGSARPLLEPVLSQNLREGAFEEAYVGRYGVADLTPFESDYRGFLRLVLPKVIGRMARDRGYRIIEHFVAKYNRPSHRLICHSFEFEPLAGKIPAKKYEPRFKKLKWDELTEEVSSLARGKADDAYVEFLPALVWRDPDDVKSILQGDCTLEAELKQEADSLIKWWEAKEPE